MEFMETIKRTTNNLTYLRAQLEEQTGKRFNVEFEEKDKKEFTVTFKEIKDKTITLSEKIRGIKGDLVLLEDGKTIGLAWDLVWEYFDKLLYMQKQATKEFIEELYTEGVGKIGDDRKIKEVAKRILGKRYIK